MPRAKTSSPARAQSRPRSRTRPKAAEDWIADHDQRWRPRDRRGPVCRHTFRGKVCEKRGAHYCEPRADRVVRFFAELLVHTKGPFARQAFVLRPWQEHDIVRPIFGEVLWSVEWGRYVRRYRIAYIIVARKNGKSELVAGMILYLLCGDDEDSAEVYGAAKDVRQAGKVFEPALRMVELSPVLAKRLRHHKTARRLVDEKTSSFIEIIAGDAEGELGHNPHGFYLDEVLSQPDGNLWTSMRTAVGARAQPLLLCMSTETSKSVSFGASVIDEAEKVQEDPKRTPHVFAYVRKRPKTQDQLDRLRRLFPNHPDLPVDLDWQNERNWKWPNPALDDFLSRASMREECLEAVNDPAKENGFRQFKLNERVQQVTRYLSLDLWDANKGELWLSPTWRDEQLRGQRCWGGLDLSSRLDLTAWCLVFRDGTVRWRFWCPQAIAPRLNEITGGAFDQWVAAGWIKLTEGDVIDYETVYAEIQADAEQFSIVNATYDKWSGEPVRQAIVERTGLDMVESGTTYERMTSPMKEMTRLLKSSGLAHGGNPVARWNAECLEAKSPVDDPERVRPVKPDRNASKSRIDGIPALLFALDGRMREPDYDLLDSVLPAEGQCEYCDAYSKNGLPVEHYEDCPLSREEATAGA